MVTTTMESMQFVSHVRTTVRTAHHSQFACLVLPIRIESQMELFVPVDLAIMMMEFQQSVLLVLLSVWNARIIWSALFATRRCIVNCQSAIAIASASSTTSTLWPLQLSSVSLATFPARLVQLEPATTASLASPTGTSPTMCVLATTDTMRVSDFVTCVIRSVRLAQVCPTTAPVALVDHW